MADVGAFHVATAKRIAFVGGKMAEEGIAALNEPHVIPALDARAPDFAAVGEDDRVVVAACIRSRLFRDAACSLKGGDGGGRAVMAWPVAPAVVVHAILRGIVLLDASGALQRLVVIAMVLIDEVGVPSHGGGIRATGRVDLVIVVHRVHVPDEAHLLEVAAAGDHAPFFARLAQGGQQHGRQNRDDRDDHQQFNQRKSQKTFHDSKKLLLYLDN